MHRPTTPALSLDPLMVVTARPVWILPVVLVICLLLTTPGAPRQRGLLAVWSVGLLVALALPLNPRKLTGAIQAAALALLPMPQALRGALNPPDDRPVLRAALPPSDRQAEPKLVLYSL